MDKTAVFTGGGTGGHVYPALPLIRKLQDQGFSIIWIGSRQGMEKNIVQEDWGVEYRAISTGKLRRYFSLKNFTDVFRILAGVIQSFFMLGKIKPAFIFSKGGFVSVPPVLAGFLLGIPSFTHDSDLKPGLATRINHRFTCKTFVAYEESVSWLGGRARKICISGNPVREEFFRKEQPLPPPWDERIRDRPLLMVLGGSSGARQINRLILEILPEILELYTVIHQTGEQNSELAGQEVPGGHYYRIPYLKEELPPLLQHCELAVARAGAGTLWELAVSVTPAILIPLRAGSRGDQVDNAALMKGRGMAQVLESAKPESRELLALIKKLAGDKEACEKMKKNCRNYVNKRAEDVIMPYLMEVMK